MRALIRNSGWAMLLAAAGLAPVFAADNDNDKTYDLRGPAPVKGQVYISKMKLRITDADTTLKVMGQSISVKVTMDMIGEEEEKVLAVDGRNVAKSQSKINKDHSDVTTTAGGQTMTETQANALEGEVVISERIGEGKWKNSLVDAKPTEKQKIELDNRNGIENDDELYPAEKVKAGHAWTVEAKALTKLLGNAFSDVKGEMKQKFLRVEEYSGEECAVIESSGVVKAKMKDDEGQPNLNVEMDLKVTSWRSIKGGFDLKEKIEGKIKLNGTQKVDGQSVQVTMSGPMSGETTTKLKK